MGFLASLFGGPIIGGLINAGKAIIINRQKKAILKAEGKLRIAEAKIARSVKRLEGDIDYNVEAQKGMQASWKDEFLVVVLWGFFAACFVPPLQPHIKEGLSFLSTHAPWWLEYSLVGSVVASFGLKGWKFWELKNMVRNGNGPTT